MLVSCCSLFSMFFNEIEPEESTAIAKAIISNLPLIVLNSLLKGNSTVKTNRAQINVHTFNKLFPKNLGPNHFSKREIVRQSSQIIQISTPCCSFPCRRKSGQRPECDVIACFFIAGIKNTYRRAIQISKTTSCYKQNAALCCAIVRKWQLKNQRDGYKLS